MDAVAEAANRLNQLVLVALVDLGSKEAHECVERVLLNFGVEAPDGFDDGAARCGAARTAHEEFEKAILGGSEMNFVAAAKDAMRAKIERKVADDEAVCGRGSWAARKSAQASEKFGERERLREVIVDTRIEALDDIGDCVARGEHQDRYCAAVFSQAASHFDAVEARKHPIENDHVELIGLTEREAFLAVGSDADDVVLFGQAPFEEVRHGAVVFYDEDSHGFASSAGDSPSITIDSTPEI